MELIFRVQNSKAPGSKPNHATSPSPDSVDDLRESRIVVYWKLEGMLKALMVELFQDSLLGGSCMFSLGLISPRIQIITMVAGYYTDMICHIYTHIYVYTHTRKYNM